MHPARGDGFDLTHDVSQAVHGPEPNKHMDMIPHATNGLGDTVELPHYTPKESMKLPPPLRHNHGNAVFSGEDEMIVQREMGGSHDPAKLPGDRAGCKIGTTGAPGEEQVWPGSVEWNAGLFPHHRPVPDSSDKFP